MSAYPIESIDPATAFSSLAELPQPPKGLYIRGSLDCIKDKKLIAVVGSRKCTSYGKNICRTLIEGLRGYPVAIVSGLALGIDSVAHETALDSGIPTISFPGSGLDWKVLYPASHRGLAERILTSGGALISEYAPEMRATYWTFPQRNRLMAGIADIVIIVEAEEKSGTLITARLATEYNRMVGAIPGSVTSSSSRGTNWLLKMGAVPITESMDIVRELGLDETPKKGFSDLTLFNSDEDRVLGILTEPKSRDAIISLAGISASELAIILTTLEIKGAVRESLGMIEKIL